MKSPRLRPWWERAVCALLAALMALPANVVVAIAQSGGSRITINEGDVSRSVVTNLTVTITNSLVPVPDGFSVRRLPFGPALDSSNLFLTTLGQSNAYRLTFTNLPGNRLPDGNFLASVVAAPATNPAGPRISDSFPLFSLFGDRDGDRDVDFYDTFGFRTTWLLGAGEAPFDPRFDADGDGLVGSNDLALFNTNYFTVLSPSPGLFAHLETDDGASPGDSLTTAAGIIGQAFFTNVAARVEAALGVQTDVQSLHYQDITAELLDGAFHLDSNRLARLAGQPLMAGAYEFSVRIVETNQLTSARFELPFRIAGGGCLQFATLDGWDWGATTNGLAGAPAGGVTAENCEAVLIEGGSFAVELSRQLVVPEGAAVLVFDFHTPEFDTAASGRMRDTFEAALVDSAGRPLTFTVQGSAGITSPSDTEAAALPPIPTAFLNLTEGLPSAWASGTLLETLPGGLLRASVDVRPLGEGTSARLVLRLVNNDGDQTGNVRIVSYHFTAEVPEGLSKGANVPAFALGTQPGTQSIKGLGNPTASNPAPEAVAPTIVQSQVRALETDANRRRRSLSALRPPSAPWLTNVVLADGFKIETYAEVDNPMALSFPKPNSAFLPGLYVCTGVLDERPYDYILRVDADRQVETVTRLLDEADAGSIEFSDPTGPYGDYLYISANGRDGGRGPWDFGGTIQRMAPNGVWTDFSPVGIPDGPGEPRGITFSSFSGSQSYLYLADSESIPAEVVQLLPDGSLVPVAGDGKQRGGGVLVDLAEITWPSGNKEIVASNWDAYNESTNGLARLRSGETNLSIFVEFTDLVWCVEPGIGGAFGKNLYATVYNAASGQTTIYQVTESGETRVFASGLPNLGDFPSIATGILAFSPDTKSLFIADNYHNLIYKVSPPEDSPSLILNVAQVPAERPTGSSVALSGVVGYTGSTSGRGEIIAVTVNGKPVEALDAAGNFFTGYTVQSGRNALRIEAEDSLGQKIFSEAVVTGVSSDISESSKLEVVTSAIHQTFGRTGLRGKGPVLYSELSLRNAGTYALNRSLLVGITGLSDPSVKVLGADGVTADGIPYYDYSSAVSGGRLEPGQTTALKTLAFDNPEQVPFTFELVVLGQANRAPAFVSIPPVNAATGRMYRYSARAIDPDGEPITYSLLVSPLTTSFDPASGTITWNPGIEDTGNHEVRLQAYDDHGGLAEQAFMISVAPPASNRPPVFRSTPITVVRANGTNDGGIYTYHALAIDPDADELTYSVLAGPEGFSINPATGAATWAPTIRQIGEHSVSLQAIDGRGGIATQSYTLLALGDPLNRAPVITQFEPTNYFAKIVLRNSITYNVTIRDFSSSHPDFGKFWGSQIRPGIVETNLGPDGKPVYSATPPANTSIAGPDSFSEWFRDVPGVNQSTNMAFILERKTPGSDVFRFYEQNDFDPINGQLGGNEGEAHNGLFTLEAHSEHVYYGREQLEFRSDDDLWVFINGKLVVDMGGLHGEREESVRLDGLGLKSGEKYKLDFFYAERYLGATLGFEVVERPLPDGEVDYVGKVSALDPDGDQLTYEMLAGPPGMMVEANSGKIEWRNSGPLGTNVQVRIVVSDQRGAFDLKSFRMNPIQNVAGWVVGHVFWDSNENGLLDEGIWGETPGELPASGLAVFLDSNGNGIHDLWEVGKKTDPFGSFAFYNVSSGRYSIQLELSSGIVETEKSTGSEEFALDVGNGGLLWAQRDIGIRKQLSSDVNRPPMFRTLQESAVVHVGETFEYSAKAYDPDGDQILFNLISPPNGVVVDGRQGFVAWRPSVSELGDHVVFVRASDGRGGAEIQSFLVSVLPLNTSPVLISNLPLVAVVDHQYAIQLVAQDAESQAIQFSVTNPPVGLTLNDSSGLLIWTPVLGQIGTNRVEVIVTDSEGASSSKVFLVEVRPSSINTPPTFVGLPRRQTRIEAPWSYQVRAVDADADPLLFSLVSGPQGMFLTNRFSAFGGDVQESRLNTAFLLWTPTADQEGPHDVVLKVSDGYGGVANQRFQMAVGSTLENRKPAIVSNPPRAASVGLTLEYDLMADDADGDALRWRVVSGASGVSINPESGSFRWTPSLDQLGTNRFVVEVSDPFLGTDQQEFLVDVEYGDRPPSIVSTPPVSVSKEAVYFYSARAEDPEEDQLTWTLIEPPLGMTVNGTNGLVRWAVPADAVGGHVVRVRVSDDRGGSDTQTYTLYVTNEKANKAPIITSIPPRGATLGQWYSYQISATDADGDLVTLSLLQGPQDSEFIPGASSAGRASGEILWWGRWESSEPAEFLVAARDPSGASSVQRFTVTVRRNEPPRISSTPSTNGIPNVLYRYDLVATDPNGDPLSYRLRHAPTGMTMDSLGRIQWRPGPGSLGSQNVAVEVADSFGGTVQQTFQITLSADKTPPVVSLSLLSGLVNLETGDWVGDLGSTVQILVQATDNVRVTETSLRIGGQTFPLSSSGVASIPVTNGGPYELTGEARDAAGNVGTVTRPIQFRDPNATNSLFVSILSPTNDAVITKRVPIVATITNAVDIVKYRVDFAPADAINLNNIAEANPAWIKLNEVTLAKRTKVLEAVTVATFDPLSLINDSYIIRVFVQPESGPGWYEPVVIGVQGDLKFGEFRIAFTDLTVPLAGIPITVSRVYDSRLAGRNSDFGYGWSLGVQDAMIRVGTRDGTVQPGSRAYLTGPDGRRLGFTTEVQVSGGLFALLQFSFRPDAGIHDRLEGDDLVEVYAGRGSVTGPPQLNIARLTTRDGTRYDYSRTAGLQFVTDTTGNHVAYTRDGIFHYPAGSTNSDQSIQFVRDARGRIERIIDPTGAPLVYSYDGAGDLRAFTDQATSITRYAYDSRRAHFLTNIVDPFGKDALSLVYDDTGKLKEIRDAAGNPVKQDFDADSNVGTFTDGRTNQTFVYFDDRGNETNRIVLGISTNSFAYDEKNNLTNAVNARGYATNFVYDPQGNVTRITDALTNITEIAYNELGKPTAVTNALKQVLHLQYDRAGHLIEVINNLGLATRVGRDAQGRVTNLVDAVGNTTSFVYEGGCSCGRPGIVYNPDGFSRHYEYDSFGRTNVVINELGATNRFDYAPDGRLRWSEDAMGNRTTNLYDGARLTSIVDALGRETQFRYDALGRTNFIITAEGGTNEFRYDANGNRTHVIDAVGNVTQFVYDAANRVTNRIDTFGHTNHFVLDPAGNQIETIDRNGRRRTFAYDALGRMTNEVWWEGAKVVKSIVFGFNELGVQTLAADDVARYDYRFDGLNRLERVLQSAVTNQTDFTLIYSYTDNGQVATVADNWGVQVGSKYDSRNRLKTRTWQGGDVGQARVDFGFDAAGNRIQTDRYSDLTGTNRIGFTTNAYNLAGIVTNITHLGPVGETLARYDYQFDAAWQIRQWTINAQPSTFGYDATGQLTNAVNTTQPNENFRFDANGNRVGAQTGGSYAVGDNNQILSDSMYSYGYDAEGSMTSRTNLTTGATTLYNFDHRNRLTGVVDRDSAGAVTQTVEFSYDAMNRRSSKTVNEQQNTKVVHFYYNQQDSWADLGGSNIVVARYLHGARIDELLARQRGNDGGGWYLTDHLETVRDIANAAGTVVAHVDYKGFGRVLSVSDSRAVDRFLFSGRELDEETGLYFYRSRYYSSHIGRFVNQDPISFSSGDNNLYRYVHNSPLFSSDPNGTMELLIYAARAAYIGAAYGTIKYSLCSILYGTPFTIEGLGQAQISGAKVGVIVYLFLVLYDAAGWVGPAWPYPGPQPPVVWNVWKFISIEAALAGCWYKTKN